jgi:hypothetical protein
METSNSKKYPEAWKVYVDCVRKWETKNLEKYHDGWKYGIPDPTNPKNYLYSSCPGRLFLNFKDLFYKRDELRNFRHFLWELEMMEGKINRETYQYLTT